MTAPNPSLMTGSGTNTYIVGIDEVAVIDPGPDDPEHIDAIIRAVHRNGPDRERIRWVLLTHTHSDHAPGAPRLARLTGAQILAFSAASPVVTADRTLGDGETLAGEGFALEAIHTPGHASNHLCFFLQEEQALFSGDLIMSGSTVVIAPPDGDMAAYFRSLERVKRRQAARIYPGHGEVIDAPLAVIEEYIRHRLMRERQVLEVLRDGPRTIADLVPRIYTDLPDALHALAARSVHAHLLKLMAEGKVSGRDRESEWRLI